MVALAIAIIGGFVAGVMLMRYKSRLPQKLIPIKPPTSAPELQILKIKQATLHQARTKDNTAEFTVQLNFLLHNAGDMATTILHYKISLGNGWEEAFAPGRYVSKNLIDPGHSIEVFLNSKKHYVAFNYRDLPKKNPCKIVINYTGSLGNPFMSTIMLERTP